MGSRQGGGELVEARGFIWRSGNGLRDPLSGTGLDPDHSVDEERFVIFGVSTSGRLLVVAHTERGDTIRIISARPATSGERIIYEEG
jgi:uncharacterized protein